VAVAVLAVAVVVSVGVVVPIPVPMLMLVVLVLVLVLVAVWLPMLPMPVLVPVLVPVVPVLVRRLTAALLSLQRLGGGHSAPAGGRGRRREAGEICGAAAQRLVLCLAQAGVGLQGVRGRGHTQGSLLHSHCHPGLAGEPQRPVLAPAGCPLYAYRAPTCAAPQC
jgi:hypothetical protein